MSKDKGKMSFQYSYSYFEQHKRSYCAYDLTRSFRSPICSCMDGAKWVGVEFRSVMEMFHTCEGRRAALLSFDQCCGLGHVCVNPGNNTALCKSMFSSWIVEQTKKVKRDLLPTSDTKWQIRACVCWWCFVLWFVFFFGCFSVFLKLRSRRKVLKSLFAVRRFCPLVGRSKVYAHTQWTLCLMTVSATGCSPPGGCSCTENPWINATVPALRALKVARALRSMANAAIGCQWTN